MPILLVLTILLSLELLADVEREVHAPLAVHVEDDAGKHVSLAERAKHRQHVLVEVLVFRELDQAILDVVARAVGVRDDVFEHATLQGVGQRAEERLDVLLPALGVAHGDVEGRVGDGGGEVLFGGKCLGAVRRFLLQHLVEETDTVLGEELEIRRELPLLAFLQLGEDGPARVHAHELLIERGPVAPDVGAQVVVALRVVDEEELATPLDLYTLQPQPKLLHVSQGGRESENGRRRVE
mmetsp:Transcript_32231/g.79104  ORF Transcript_32231/g.79104 Transcript_32231/m.79104 type:complete len:239 (+) Transcript_32231:2982-3698(+)